MKTARDTVGWILVATMLVAIPVAWREAVLDDAFIAFRYAHNLASGVGLVFNPGERVEGFTSPLWTLIMAAGISAGADPAILAQILSVLCNITLAAVVYRFGRRQLGFGAGWAWAPVALLVANVNLGAWAAHGLETNLFALLVMAGAASLVPELARKPPGRRLLGGLALGMATWTRPEGVVFLPVILLAAHTANRCLPGTRRARHGDRDRPVRNEGNDPLPLLEAARRELPALLTWLLLVVALFLGRRAYYGAWLPNTYYAKATGGAGALSNGLDYLRDFVLSSWLYGAAVIPAVLALSLRRTPARWVLAAMVATNVAYVVWLGGDTFAGARFFMPALGPSCLLVADGLAAVLERLPFRQRARNVCAGALVLAMAGATVLVTWPPLARQAELAASMTRNRAYLGRLLRAITPPETLMALTTVGALPYHAERPVIDLYGLTDAHIARVHVIPGEGGGTGHEKGDGRYVLSRSPDLILLRNVWIADVPIEDHRALYGLSEHQIAADPRFREAYVPVDLQLRPDLLFGFYANKHSVDIDALEAAFAKQDLSAFGPLERLNSERGMDLVFFRQGLDLVAAGRLEAARVAFSRSLSLYPGSVDVHLAMARLLESQGEWPEATKHLEQARNLSPDRADILAGLGAMYARTGRLEEAARTLQKATQLVPADRTAWEDLATVLLKQQRHAEAVPVLQHVVDLDPEAHEAWVKLGVSAAMAGDWHSARCALERARALAPDTPEVLAFQVWFAAHAPASVADRPCLE